MSYLELPVRKDLKAFEYQITLEETIFTLRFSWNARMGSWVLDILDSAGSELVVGIRLISSWPIADRFRDERMPKGTFLLFDTAGEDADPDLDTFGDRVVLIYRESTTED